MVLPTKVGKARNFGLVVLFGFLTFGVYFLVWSWKAHGEVRRQFELEAEGRKKGTLWFVLGIVLGGPFMLLYDWIWVSNLQHVRRRLGLQGGITPATFLLLNVVASVGIIAVNIWLRIVAQDHPPAPGSSEIPKEWLPPLFTLVGVAVLGLILSFVAWGWVQANTNQVWREYPTRLGAWYAGAAGAGLAPGAAPFAGAPGVPAAPGAAGAPPAGFPLPGTPPAPGSKRMKCPRCGTLVWIPPGTKPVCPNCGFGTPPPSPPAPPGPPAPPA